MSEAAATRIILETIMNEEKSEDRKQKLCQEIEILFNGLAAGLDSRARENFNPRFTALKTFLVEYTL